MLLLLIILYVEYDLSAVYLDADYSESLSPQQSAASNQGIYV